MLGEGVKSCLFGRKIADLEPHSYVPADHRWDTPELPAPSDHATKEIFQKTLGFFCAISRLGCNYPAEKEKTASRTQTTEDQMQDSCDNEDIEEDLTLSTDANNASEPLGTATLPADLKCKGKILLEYTAEGVPFVRYVGLSLSNNCMKAWNLSDDFILGVNIGRLDMPLIFAHSIYKSTICGISRHSLFWTSLLHPKSRKRRPRRVTDP